jgi:tetratricopeptide (TPR) repeat protein
MKKNKMTYFSTYALSALCWAAMGNTVFAEDSFREKVIRNSTLGYDSQERAIQQDRQNRLDNQNFNSNQFGSALDFVNRMEQRSQSRAGTGREGLFECMFCTKDEEDNYLPFQREHDDIWIKLFDDEPIGNLPNYAERAFFAIEYKLRFSRDRENSDHDRIYRLDERRPLEIAKAGFLLGLREPGVYKPDPKRALKILNRLIMEDGELYRAGKETDAPQLNFLLGMIYLNGAGIAADPQKALDYFKLATEWKNVMIDDNHGKKRKIHYTSEKYVIFSNYAQIYMARNGIGMEKSDAKARHIARETLALIALKRSDMPEINDTVYIGDDDKLLMWNDVGDMMEQEAKLKYGELYASLIAQPETEYIKPYKPSLPKPPVKLTPHEQAANLVQSGTAKNGSKDYQGAVADFTHAIELDPKYAEAYQRRGGSRGWLGDNQGWLDDLNKAISLEPKVAVSYAYRAVAKEYLKDWAGRVSDYEKAVALDPTNQDYKNKLNSAKSTLQWDTMMATEEKSHPQAYALYQNGMTKFRAKDYQGAIEDFNGAIKSDPKFAEAYKSRGNAKSWLGDNQGRIEDLTKAIELEPKNALSYSDRGDGKSYLKDWTGQIADYEKAVQIDPNNQRYKDKLNNAKNNLRWNVVVSAEEKSNPQAHTLFQSGIKKHDVKDYQGAIADFTSAIEADPKFSPAYKRRGLSKGWLGDNQGWLADMDVAISLESNIAFYYDDRALVKSYLKDGAGSIADWEKAVALDPTNQGYKDKLNAAKSNKQ